MNLRILKKLSKRAAPLLAELGDDREQFRAVKDDNYTGLLILCRKNFERLRSTHDQTIREGEIKRRAADGKGWIAMWPPHHPRKGTIMVGATSGYYEPEWDEETAWEALERAVIDHFMEWDEDGPTRTRIFAHPGEIFAAVPEVLAARSKEFALP